MLYYRYYDSPLGRLTIVSTSEKITHLFLTTEQFDSFRTGIRLIQDDQIKVLVRAIEQLNEYFHEKRKQFDLPFEFVGTEFQKKVWKQVSEIPFGKVWSYQDVAIGIGKQNAVRAIGQANKANKLPIFIPCHRVIGKNKRLTGYAGAKTELKAILLTHENISFKE